MPDERKLNQAYNPNSGSIDHVPDNALERVLPSGKGHGVAGERVEKVLRC